MSVTLASTGPDDTVALKLAREIAMDLHSIETILKRYDIPAETWAKLSQNTYFRTLVREQAEAWQSALNTQERTKLKAAAMFEEWLPEANRRAHDPGEPLSSKVELMKLLKTVSGIGIGNATDGGGGEKFSVTINLGADAQLKFEKQAVPTIEGEVVKDK